MIYPNNFENKIEFSFIRNYLNGYSTSDLGREYISNMSFSTNIGHIKDNILQTMEFVDILKFSEFPDLIIYDVRPCLKHLKIEHTYLTITELYQLYKCLNTTVNIISFLNKKDVDNNNLLYPNLAKISIEILSFPDLIKNITRIIDENGNIKDNASPELSRIRKEKSAAERNVSKVLTNIMRQAQKDGYVDADTSPSIRDGRLVIPVLPAYKRKISGIVHDESDTGKTIYIEPTQVVEANNEITELENAERKEIIRILKETSSLIRPHLDNILSSMSYLGMIDFVRSKAKFAIQTESRMPDISNQPTIDWNNAVHPILKICLEKKGFENQKVVPLDIKLSYPTQRILIISGPNAGGKSVCLKTVGLLQYMLQCGMPIPVGLDSRCGIFKDIFINIGDEQSIENELSTFSSHLMNMKTMMKYSGSKSLLLIDEFGGGTEPMIGGALAQAMLRKLNNNHVFAVITTHFQILKQYAQENEGIVNGAMLYDRGEMRPLFQLRIGSPGSSFAIEIARKIGIPTEVIDEASNIVGADYVSADKYLQDIIRDKRYWENKRNEIHQRERRMVEVISTYETEISRLREEKRNILNNAKEEAKRVLESSNAIIEKTIKEIKESQAERERTKQSRQELSDFKKSLDNNDNENNDILTDNKAERLKERQAQRAKKRDKRKKSFTSSDNCSRENDNDQSITFKEGDYVKMKGQQTVGKIIKINGNKEAFVAFGSIQMNVKIDNLEPSSPPKVEKRDYTFISRETRENIRETALNFKSEIDVRGMRADEALQAVTYFIDDAQVASVRNLKILHGTGNGILRNLIRQYLSTVPAVKSYRDEHPQFGGAGITIIELD